MKDDLYFLTEPKTRRNFGTLPFRSDVQIHSDIKYHQQQIRVANVRIKALQEELERRAKLVPPSHED